MQRNIRMFPPMSGPLATSAIIVNGRTYTPSVSFVDVPDFDAEILGANGWIRCRGFTGSTSQRPITGDTGAISGGPATQVPPGTMFLDTTVGAFIVWDGASWRNPVNGNAV